LKPAVPLPDLHFDETAGVSGTKGREPVGDEGLKVVTTFLDGQGLTDALKIYPRDWGGWSTLRVTAILPGGRRVTGKYRGAAEEHVRVPERAAGDRIARSWRRAKGASGPDAEDADDQPAGDGNRGDGLTLYEEYRGFYEEGEHGEGHPKKKDYFAVNEAGGVGRGGLALFQRITGLAVHGKLKREELSESRVVTTTTRRLRTPSISTASSSPKRRSLPVSPRPSARSSIPRHPAISTMWACPRVFRPGPRRRRPSATLRPRWPTNFSTP
jgi:hypothetical protein